MKPDASRHTLDCAASEGEALNAGCGCEVVDVHGLRERVLRELPAPPTDQAGHAGLFSPYAVFIEPAALQAMADLARAVFDVAAMPAYADTVLRWAPPLAALDPGSPGGVIGFDFHLTVDGPRLIEINTNPGGLLLNALLVDHVASCAPDRWRPPATAASVRAAGVAAWIHDLALQLGRPPGRIAIVDEAPEAQFLYPEFRLYAEAFREQGIDSAIVAPESCRFDGRQLVDGEGPIDAVYNRLTDFALQTPAVTAIAEAYRACRLALSPHPRAHALLADKRDLAVLGDAPALERLGVDPVLIGQLTAGIPPTLVLDDALRPALWADRAGYFFKPATGFGSRGSYRGDKLTRRAWEGMASRDYVAQALVPPGLRIAHEGARFKVDVRCYAATTGPILFAARLYQGQTTNMRTAGGGFAAVMTAETSQPRA